MANKKEVNRVKAVLKEQGRSQSWLAEKLGYTFATVNGWCNNRNQPYLVDIVRMAELLEVAPADLIVDGAKKGKGLTESQAFTEFS
ncbi:helix-turn-helix transcriptional regulator [Flavilitoribacter nigricans]|uniref:Transcriptional regulator n=1 Tax=Flavilitoribacter nigricans (strain ATCC 23147 / DSM 23189 / NBRC 102662 / NCIMB 1420 / SS-2) TaxID=1122177 RepID=A0A2D0N669_FLAN2|nr:helix-turn-helix transcriptional regulator [Flavilitoribacter nigricans]PHN03880.1 transcriptional regulator [Flavilitoribacter nigricans DSM 23189 = NBRC 102662]